MYNTVSQKLTPFTCSDRSRVPDTGRGSKQIVLIEAGGFYPGTYGIFTKFSPFTSRSVKIYKFSYASEMRRFGNLTDAPGIIFHDAIGSVVR